MTGYYRSCWTLLALVVTSTFCGCGTGQTHSPVKGKVLFRKSIPAKGAIVVFHPEGNDSTAAIRPSGTTDDDGVFELMTEKPGDGAPPGVYLVAIHWKKEAAAPALKKAKGFVDDEFSEPGSSALAPRFSDPRISTIRVEVKAGANELEPFYVE